MKKKVIRLIYQRVEGSLVWLKIGADNPIAFCQRELQRFLGVQATAGDKFVLEFTSLCGRNADATERGLCLIGYEEGGIHAIPLLKITPKHAPMHSFFAPRLRKQLKIDDGVVTFWSVKILTHEKKTQPGPSLVTRRRGR